MTATLAFAGCVFVLETMLHSDSSKTIGENISWLNLSVAFVLLCVAGSLHVWFAWWFWKAEQQLALWLNQPQKNKTLMRFLKTQIVELDKVVSVCKASVENSDLQTQEQVELAKSLQDSEARYQRLLAGLKNEYVFYTHDSDGQFTYFSPSIKNVLGFSEEEAIERFSKMIKTGRDQAMVKAENKDSVLGLTPLEVELRHKDGSLRIFEIHDYPVLDQFCNVCSVEGIARDITRRKSTEKQLHEAQIAAEQANRAKSVFLSSMSHELRTPLNGVLGYVQVLQRDESFSRGQKQCLSGIESCGQHLLHVISDVLDLTKIESGNMELDKKPCEFSLIIHQVEDMIKQRAEQKGLSFKIQTHKDLPQVITTDDVKLKQILLNLLGNSIKFTERGSILLRIERASPTKLAFEVSDTGAGIPHEQLTRVFEAFKQTETGKNAGGTGLGLAITKKMVELLSGKIEVESEVGSGTTFRFTIALHDEETDDLTQIAKSSLIDTWNPILPPELSVSVLIADDNTMSTDIMVRLFESAGFDVVAGLGCEDVLKKIQNKSFAMILIDIDYIQMKLTEIVTHIKSHAKDENMRVIALSTNAIAGYDEEIRAAGFDELIVKPIYMAELFQKVQKMLSIEFIDVQTKNVEKNFESDVDFKNMCSVSLDYLVRLDDALQVGDVEKIESALATLLELRDNRIDAASKDLQQAHYQFDMSRMSVIVQQLKQDILGELQ
ncbi:MAG: ATP-binding protein [Pseudomonadota bacterium]